MELWGGMTVTAVAAAGNLTQLYPNYAPVGAALPAAAGAIIRKPTQGFIHEMNINSDEVNGGSLELWDLSGFDAGADVSSGTTITNAQLTAMQALGRAKLLFVHNFVSDPKGPTPAFRVGSGFQQGLAARYIGGAAGVDTIQLSLTVEGGFYLCSTAG